MVETRRLLKRRYTLGGIIGMLTLLIRNYSGCVSVARGMNGWPRSAFSMAKTTL